MRILDYVCQAAPFWHFFGRLGCFAAGCCYGRPVAGNVPWAVSFTDPKSQIPFDLLAKPLHPTQLYEGFGDLAITAFLFAVVLPKSENGRLKSGTLAAAYFGLYGVLRFVVEFYRGDVVNLPFIPMSAAQAGCIALVIVAISIFLSVKITSWWRRTHG